MKNLKRIVVLIFVMIFSVALLYGCTDKFSIRNTDVTETETQAPDETTAVSSAESTLAPTPTKKPPTPTPTEIPLNYAIEPQFDYASEFNQYGFATAYIGENDEDREYFYINEQGEFVNNPLFGIDEDPWGDCLKPFVIYCGLDLFPEGDLYGYVNENNEVAIEPQYEEAQPFSPNGLAGVMVDGKWGYINEKNEMVIEPQYDMVDMFFSNGNAGVSKDGKFTLIDSTGKVVKSTDYDYFNVDFTLSYGTTLPILNHQNAKFLRCYDESTGKWGLMNIDGKEILAPEYTSVPVWPSWGDPEEGLFVVEKEEGMWGIVSQSGEVILEPIYDSFWVGETDIAAIISSDDEKAGYINKEGKFITETRFVYATLFASNGLAAVCEDYADDTNMEWGKFGYIGVDGTYKIDPVFDWANEFTSLGLAYVEKDDMSGLINSEGEFVYTASGEIEDITDFRMFGDLLQIRYSDRTEYVNSSGEIDKVMPAGTYWYFPEYDTYLIRSADTDWNIGMIDSEGDVIIEPQFPDFYMAIEEYPWQGPVFENRSTLDLLMVHGENYAYFGVINFEGEEIIPAVFEDIGVVSENGMVPVFRYGKYGYIDIDS